MSFIYIIGAQCTGKSTLSRAIIEELKTKHTGLKCRLLEETARTVLRTHGYDRADIKEGGQRCIELQELIMEGQLIAEKQVIEDNANLVVSDRSGIDPLVYAHVYCGDYRAEQLLSHHAWQQLKNNIMKGVVVVCEPVKDWLFDDGTRIMPSDWEEWTRTHDTFRRLLEKHTIEHHVLPRTVTALEDRVRFVLSLSSSGGSWSFSTGGASHEPET